LALGAAGADGLAPAADLDLGLRLGAEVVGPGRQPLVAGVGVDEDHVGTVGEVDDRRRTGLARLAPGRRQQQDRGLADLAPEAAAGGPVERDVELAGQAQAARPQRVRETSPGEIARHDGEYPIGYGAVNGRSASLPPRRRGEGSRADA